MSDRFDDCLVFILAREGGYSNHPSDRGGATNKGITQARYDDWLVRQGLARQPVVGISMDEVRTIYRDGYWNAVKAFMFPEPVDLVLFDAAVNSGPARSARWLQAVAGAKQDGDIGPQTVAAANAMIEKIGAKDFAREMVRKREEFIYDLIERDPSQATFANGWANRLALLRSAINEV